MDNGLKLIIEKGSLRDLFLERGVSSRCYLVDPSTDNRRLWFRRTDELVDISGRRCLDGGVIWYGGIEKPYLIMRGYVASFLKRVPLDAEIMLFNYREWIVVGGFVAEAVIKYYFPRGFEGDVEPVFNWKSRKPAVSSENLKPKTCITNY